MSKQFESLDQPLMVEIIRRRQLKDNNADITPVINQSLDKAKIQLDKNTLEEDMRNFLAAQEFVDSTLTLNGSSFPAHKTILIARSAYFEGLFRSFSGSDNTVQVQIGETSPSVTSFQSLLRYTFWKSYFWQNSHFEIHIFHKIHILKFSFLHKIHFSEISFFTKFTIVKSQFSQNSHFEIHIFDKIHIFKVAFFSKFTFLESHFRQNSHF